MSELSKQIRLAELALDTLVSKFEHVRSHGGRVATITIPKVQALLLSQIEFYDDEVLLTVGDVSPWVRTTSVSLTSRRIVDMKETL